MSKVILVLHYFFFFLLFSLIFHYRYQRQPIAIKKHKKQDNVPQSASVPCPTTSANDTVKPGEKATTEKQTSNPQKAAVESKPAETSERAEDLFDLSEMTNLVEENVA